MFPELIQMSKPQRGKNVGMTREARPSGMNFDIKRIYICPLQAVAFVSCHILSVGQKWSTVPFTGALKYYIPLGDMSIVAWPSSLKREAFGEGEG